MASPDREERKCNYCDKILKSKGGKTLHQNKCRQNVQTSKESAALTSTDKSTDVTANERNANNPKHQHHVLDTKKPPDPPTTDEVPDRENGVIIPSAHELDNAIPAIETFYWGNRKGSDFSKDLDYVYEKIVFWRQNLFRLPSENSGKKFICETTRLVNAWVEDSAMKPISLTAIMVMPALLLQKPSRTSKSKDHIESLSRRFELWQKGDLMELLHEGETIQNHFQRLAIKRNSTKEISKKFVQKMVKGNVNGAIKLLSKNMQNGILPLDEETLKALRQKHPEAEPTNPDILLTDAPVKIHPVRFEEINAEMIRQSALKTKGGAGPSRLDGDGWRRIICSNNFVNESNDLCNALET